MNLSWERWIFALENALAHKKKMWSWFFLSCVNFMRGKQFWQFKEKFLRELKLWTWKRIGAEKKDVIQIFLSCVIFMRLCAAHRRTILRNKIKVFERDEFCTWKHIGAQKKDVILIFFHVSFTCVYARRTDAQFWQIIEKFLREMNLCTWKRIGAQKKMWSWFLIM